MLVMLAAADFLLISTASALRTLLRVPPPQATATGPSNDPLQLSSARSVLLAALEQVPPTDPKATDACIVIQEIFEEKIAPVESAIWTPDFEERKDAIIELSLGLDAIEHEVKGPFLAGRQVTAADGILYPSFVLYHNALPAHFGWEDWTSEALFYKRPRLHAWFELMGYEKRMPAAAVQEQVDKLVSELSFEWAQPVPTLSYRGVPAEYD